MDRSDLRSLLAIGIGLAALIIAGLAVQEPPADWEESIFRRLNELPHDVEPVLWVLQQMGSAIVLPIVAVVMWWRLRDWRPPTILVTAGFFLGWLAAKGIKAVVGRGRPGAILDDVVLGFDVPVAEIGFPSGHAVLAFTLATVLATYLSKAGRIVGFGIATLVGFTRIYVGAHLPLDVVGGAAYGVVIGELTNLMTRRVVAGDPPRLRRAHPVR